MNGSVREEVNSDETVGSINAIPRTLQKFDTVIGKTYFKHFFIFFITSQKQYLNYQFQNVFCCNPVQRWGTFPNEFSILTICLNH